MFENWGINLNVEFVNDILKYAQHVVSGFGQFTAVISKNIFGIVKWIVAFGVRVVCMYVCVREWLCVWVSVQFCLFFCRHTAHTIWEYAEMEVLSHYSNNTMRLEICVCVCVWFGSCVNKDENLRGGGGWGEGGGLNWNTSAIGCVEIKQK